MTKEDGIADIKLTANKINKMFEQDKETLSFNRYQLAQLDSAISSYIMEVQTMRDKRYNEPDDDHDQDKKDSMYKQSYLKYCFRRINMYDILVLQVFRYRFLQGCF